MSFRLIDPSEYEIGPVYDFFSSVVVPRPIAFVSTLSPEGIPNVAPFSYFMPGGSNPPSLAFSVAGLRPGKVKDTLRNILDTGEFCVGLVERQLGDRMNLTSAAYESAINEFEVAGLTNLPSTKIRPDRVAECRVQFECKLFQVVHHGGLQGSANYVIGEVVAIHIEESLMVEDALLAKDFRPISRMGGKNYLDTAVPEVFAMERPPKPS